MYGIIRGDTSCARCNGLMVDQGVSPFSWQHSSSPPSWMLSFLTAIFLVGFSAVFFLAMRIISAKYQMSGHSRCLHRHPSRPATVQPKKPVPRKFSAVLFVTTFLTFCSSSRQQAWEWRVVNLLSRGLNTVKSGVSIICAASIRAVATCESTPLMSLQSLSP